MRKKNVLAIISAVLMILVWSGAAFAVDTVTMNVTSEPIRALSPSDKAGGLTFIFDAGTQLLPGDIITMDLPLNVTLAQAINLEVSPAGNAIGFAAVQQTGAPFVDPTGNAVIVGTGIYFRVSGTIGTQRVTIEILGAAGDSITAGAGVDDRLELTILDQAVNADYTNLGIWDDGPFAAAGTPATLAQNTLCINVSAYSGSTVNGSFDSAGDKFTFVPSNPQIAHVVQALTINFDPCKGATPGYIEIGDRITQGSETCQYFDNEDAFSNGYCVNTHFANDVILASNSPFDLAQYTVQLDILVNGQGGNNGVYWTNDLLAVDAYTFYPGCPGAATTDIVGVYTYLNGSFAPVSAGPRNSGQCDVSAAFPDQRAVTLISPQTNLALTAGDDYIAFDLPALNYDLDEITAGDVVTVRITINKVPCGSIFTGIWDLGTFGCLSAPQTSGLLYPYFTEAGESADAYWDGFVITNPAMTDATCLVTWFEADGDQGTVTVVVPAMSQYVNLLSAMPWAQTVGLGSLGDSSGYIRVNATGASGIDGFGMMGRPDTGEAMGYLPRQMPF